MSVTQTFEKKVRAARIRCALNLLLSEAGRVLAVVGGLVAACILAERLVAVTIFTPVTFWAAAAITAGFVIVPWLLRLPNRMQASLLLDERLRLRERFSTTLALAASEDPFAKAARAESLWAVQNADVRGHFPIRLPRSWHYGAGTWLIVAAIVFLMPQKDLLGLINRRQQARQQARQVQQAQAEVKQAALSVKATVQRLDDPELAEDLKKLEELAKEGQPQEIKREAIKTLSDLSEKIEQMLESGQMETVRTMQEMFKQLQGSPDPLSQQLRMALGKGEFEKAASMLGELQKQLAEGEVSEERRRELAEQMQQLAEELKKLAAQKRELERELERLGLDKEMAQLAGEQLRRALQKQGIKSETIERLAQQMAAGEAAGVQCSNLAGALAGVGAGGGGIGADDLGGVIDELSALEMMQQQAMLMQFSLDEIGRCIGCLGSGMYEGGSWQLSEGGGGPGGGKGIGLTPASAYSTPEEIESETKRTRVDSKPGSDPIVASWYFQDTQVKGEAARQFSEVVQAGRARAADAITANEIPRRYEDAVRAYFGQLEEAGTSQ